MIHDNVGRGRVVFYAFLRNETKPMIEKLFDVFAGCLSDIGRVKTVILEKDFTEIDVVRNRFVGVRILLCWFHVLKYLRTKISQLLIDVQTKKSLLNAVRAIMYANTEVDFVTCVDALKVIGNDNFWNYFETN